MAKRLMVRIQTVVAKDRTAIRRLVLKHKLDRRKVYSVGMFGELATVEFYTGDCSGCSCDCGDGYGCSHGCSGCEECGFTGKRRNWFPSPLRVGDGYLQIHPAQCERHNQTLVHFDAGCPGCMAEAERWYRSKSAKGEK